MFYTQEILARKNGGFALLWQAATLGTHFQFKRLTKKDVISINIAEACQCIVSPPYPLALRLMSQLMVGAARIYGRQCDFHYTDVQHVWNCIKSTRMVDINMNVSTAKFESITMDDDPNFFIEIEISQSASRKASYFLFRLYIRFKNDSITYHIDVILKNRSSWINLTLISGPIWKRASGLILLAMTKVIDTNQKASSFGENAIDMAKETSPPVDQEKSRSLESSPSNILVPHELEGPYNHDNGDASKSRPQSRKRAFQFWDNETQLQRADFLGKRYKSEPNQEYVKKMRSEAKRLLKEALMGPLTKALAPELCDFWNQSTSLRGHLVQEPLACSFSPTTSEVNVSKGDFLFGFSTYEMDPELDFELELEQPRSREATADGFSFDSQMLLMPWNREEFDALSSAGQRVSLDRLSTPSISLEQQWRTSRASMTRSHDASPFFGSALGSLGELDIEGKQTGKLKKSSPRINDVFFIETAWTAGEVRQDTANFLRYVQTLAFSNDTYVVDFADLLEEIPHGQLKRGAAAQAFYHLLALSSRGILKPMQSEAYGPISIQILD
ncbi:uncharacterized protein VTP21DRAFT_8658 [Calcarisporiella thermophila]|uniref:uncharacterized protein n=1 Tax=Calcarisporiella thermophila TaxID=911321 RepID=UPI0037438564